MDNSKEVFVDSSVLLLASSIMDSSTVAKGAPLGRLQSGGWKTNTQISEADFVCAFNSEALNGYGYTCIVLNFFACLSSLG